MGYGQHAYLFLINKFISMKAVIPAAGLGTRLLPATKSQPKEMLPVFDKPTIQYVVEEAVASGIDNILIVTGRGKRSIEDHFDKSTELEMILEGGDENDQLKLRQVEKISDLADIHYIRQREQKGLGDAIYCAKKFVGDEAFAVLLGDNITIDKTPCIQQLIRHHEKYEKTIIAVERVPSRKIPLYGIVKSGKKIEPSLFEIEGMVAKPKIEDAPSDLAIMGRYVLEPEIFDYIKSIGYGVGNEIQLTDALQKLTENGGVYAHVFNGKVYDIGNKLSLLIETTELALDSEYGKEYSEYLKELIKGL